MYRHFSDEERDTAEGCVHSPKKLSVMEVATMATTPPYCFNITYWVSPSTENLWNESREIKAKRNIYVGERRQRVNADKQFVYSIIIIALR